MYNEILTSMLDFNCRNRNRYAWVEFLQPQFPIVMRRARAKKNRLVAIFFSQLSHSFNNLLIKANDFR